MPLKRYVRGCFNYDLEKKLCIRNLIYTFEAILFLPGIPPAFPPAGDVPFFIHLPKDEWKESEPSNLCRQPLKIKSEGFIFWRYLKFEKKNLRL